MGTRNLTMVKVNGELKVAQYCQWDGYPTGQGAIIAKFLHEKLILPKLKRNVERLTWVTDDTEIENLWTECGADPAKDGVTMEQAEKFKQLYPQFHRDTGADILALIQDGNVTKVKDDSEFLNDSLFCEWAYLIDLDTMTVDVYKGFQPNPSGKNTYGPCKVIKTYSFLEFTPKACEELEESLNKNEEE